MKQTHAPTQRELYPPPRIGVIGDFEPTYHSHFATNAALYDAAAKLDARLELRWLPTPSLDGPDVETILSRWDGLIASPGSPYKSFHGILRELNLHGLAVGHSQELEGAFNMLW